jgi:succinate-semialdehyde dehydrogenase / glutarate-semialdehyde dehydrogenase
MRLWREETFGPVAVVRAFSDWEEAVSLSNDSQFGLGVSVYTANAERALKADFQEGAVFVNSIVKSDPRLPFGGVKASGVGRELGPEGLLSFVNVQTVYVA